jgi:uncharacterized membrane protein (DUF106 family)
METLLFILVTVVVTAIIVVLILKFVFSWVNVNNIPTQEIEKAAKSLMKEKFDEVEKEIAEMRRKEGRE